MSEKKWIRNSLRGVCRKLSQRGHAISRGTVRRLLGQMKFGLYSNRKSLSPRQHPQRDRQFHYIRRVKKLYLQAGLPVLSVDTKKKELMGNFANAGKAWGKQPKQVNAHDFPADAHGKAVPYGIYDVTHNQGYVCVGQSADTAEFAVEAITRWWQENATRFARRDKLLILCDCGGSNGSRLRLWKQQLQEKLADALEIAVMVCHYPTGASKWNPVEHRLFGPISTNWAGQPLQSFTDVLGFIRNTTTTTGLIVKAELLEKTYQTGLKVGDSVFKALKIVRRKICPQWNYCIHPRSAPVT